MKSIVSVNEIAQYEGEGWTRTGRETVIGGKLRTVEMEKEVADPCAWIEEDNRIRREHLASHSKHDQRILRRHDQLYRRGYDL